MKHIFSVESERNRVLFKFAIHPIIIFAIYNNKKKFVQFCTKPKYEDNRFKTIIRYYKVVCRPLNYVFFRCRLQPFFLLKSKDFFYNTVVATQNTLFPKYFFAFILHLFFITFCICEIALKPKFLQIFLLYYSVL